jgi:hypothetical protein
MPLKIVENKTPEPVLTLRDVKKGDVFKFLEEGIYSNPLIRTEIRIGDHGCCVSLLGFAYHFADYSDEAVTLLPKGTLLEVV